MAADHNTFANLIWQIADLLRGPYRPPQYERVMLPMTVLRRFDCVLAPIALLKESRSALIAAAVTGQLDVGPAA
jgi:type I restriction-modification system DNA methylase subunit